MYTFDQRKNFKIAIQGEKIYYFLLEILKLELFSWLGQVQNTLEFQILKVYIYGQKNPNPEMN